MEGASVLRASRSSNANSAMRQRRAVYCIVSASRLPPALLPAEGQRDGPPASLGLSAAKPRRWAMLSCRGDRCHVGCLKDAERTEGGAHRVRDVGPNGVLVSRLMDK